jgi:O-antigen/teichoic acid export membrane protein
MGIVQKDAFRTMLISYVGIVLGYVNKGILFLIILTTEQIGLVNLIISVGTLFAQFANMGTIYTTWKFLPFFKNEEKRHHGFLPLILLIVFAGIILCTTLALVFRPQEHPDLSR